MINPSEAVQFQFFIYGLFYPLLGSTKVYFWILQAVEFLDKIRLMTAMLESGFLMRALEYSFIISPEIKDDLIPRVYVWLFTPGPLQVIVFVLLIYVVYSLQVRLGYKLYLKIWGRLEVKNE